MSRVRSEGGLKSRALVYAAVAPLIIAMSSCSYINTPAPGVFGNGTPEEDFALCSVVRTECSGWAADGTCPASNLVPLVSFQTSLCVSTTSENNQVDANNACKEFCGAALYPLAGDSRASCSATLFNMETAKQTGQCTLGIDFTGRHVPGRLRSRRTGVPDFRRRNAILPGNALRGPALHAVLRSFEDHRGGCLRRAAVPAGHARRPVIPTVPVVAGQRGDPECHGVLARNPPGAVTSFGIDAVTIGTAVAFGTTVPVIAKGGFVWPTSVHCDPDNEFCSTTLDDLQVQLADISARSPFRTLWRAWWRRRSDRSVRFRPVE